MNWYKASNKVIAENWDNFLEDLHERKEAVREEATKMGEKLGHTLNAWTSLNSCVCRKCGAYAKINGFYGSDEKVSFDGAAFSNPCNVVFNNVDDYEFEEFTNPNPKNAIL